MSVPCQNLGVQAMTQPSNDVKAAPLLEVSGAFLGARERADAGTRAPLCNIPKFCDSGAA